MPQPVFFFLITITNWSARGSAVSSSRTIVAAQSGGGEFSQLFGRHL